MMILGLGGLLRDAACAVLKDGELQAAIEESKLTRGCRPGEMPQAAVAECLRLAGATRDDVDCVAVRAAVRARPRIAFPCRSARSVPEEPRSSWWSITWPTPRPRFTPRLSRKRPC